MKKLIVHEVGLRDGLQAEKQVVPLEEKIRWAEALAESGIDILQLGSFVHPDKVPQMADTDQLFRHFAATGNATGKVTLSGLVLNEKGVDRGMDCGVEMFCMGVSASETHSRKNTGMGTAEATTRIVAMARKVVAAKKTVQLSVQSAFGCGYEGRIPEDRVMGIVKTFLDAGLRNISLADTAGHAHPQQVERLFGAIRELERSVECTCHFHNTYGLALANCYAALNSGVTCFESAIAGLGGCPFTAVAAGNVCTEDMVHMFQRMGLLSDVRLDALVEVAGWVSGFFGRSLPGTIQKTGPVPEEPPDPATNS